MGTFFAKFTSQSPAQAKRKRSDSNNSSDTDNETSTTIKSKKFKPTPVLGKQNNKKRRSFLSRFLPQVAAPANRRTIESSTSTSSLFDSSIACFTSLSSTSSSLSSSSCDTHTDPNSCNASEQLRLLTTPVKKKMTSTCEYVYTTLFERGQGSDIRVRALHRDWHLHKLYLCQSPYFASMFAAQSSWKEASQSLIDMSIPDANITERALHTAFGSFYLHEVHIVPLEVVSVLAASSLLSLEGLIGQCASVMRANVNSNSVLAYYEAALVYGVKTVEEAALTWLCHNLMSSNDTIKLGGCLFSTYT